MNLFNRKAQLYSFNLLQGLFALIVGGFVVLGGCSSTGTDPGDEEQLKLNVEKGKYKMKITGEVPGVSSGEAVFGTVRMEEMSAPVFGIHFMGVFTDQGADKDTVAFTMLRKSKKVEPGTYSFVDSPEKQTELKKILSAKKFLLFGARIKIATKEGTEGYAVTSKSGHLTILKSTPDLVTGTFSVEITGEIYTSNGVRPVSGTYKGQFKAIPRSEIEL